MPHVEHLATVHSTRDKEFLRYYSYNNDRTYPNIFFLTMYEFCKQTLRSLSHTKLIIINNKG